MYTDVRTYVYMYILHKNNHQHYIGMYIKHIELWKFETRQVIDHDVHGCFKVTSTSH